jgi:hypothetical protein
MTDIQAVEAPAVWHGAALSENRDWILELDAVARAELEAAAANARAQGISLEAAKKENFDLPGLAPVLAEARKELGEGRGFVMIRGLPVGDYSAGEIGAIFWAIGAHLGVGVSQSADGDRLGHVIDKGATDRYYTGGGVIPPHVDPVDVVGLLCMRAAPEGGASRIISSMAIHNIMLAECPELLRYAYRGYHYSRRSHGGSVTEHRVPVYAEAEGCMQSYLLPMTIHQAEEEGHPLSAIEQEALDKIAEIAARPGVYLDMDFQPGDIQFLNNRVIFHARTDYTDDPDPALKRLLLRIWLMMPDWPSRAEDMNFIANTDRAGGGFIPDRAAAG